MSDDDSEEYVEEQSNEQETTTEEKDAEVTQEEIITNDSGVDVLNHENLNASSVRKLAASRTPPPGYKPHNENKPEEIEDGFDPFLSAERHRTDINSPEVREKMKKRVHKSTSNKELGDQDNRKSVRIKDHDFD